MGERHSVLRLNIGTFAEEDEAYELLNNLVTSLPRIVVIAYIFDALLAAAYLKWLHPWKIILQKASLISKLKPTAFSREKKNGSRRPKASLCRSRLRR